MLSGWMRLLTAALAMLAGVAYAFETSDEQLAAELQMGWKMGLRPRQSSQNLQFFDGSVGGASAPPVWCSAATRTTDAATDCVYGIDLKVKRPRQTIRSWRRHLRKPHHCDP